MAKTATKKTTKRQSIATAERRTLSATIGDIHRPGKQQAMVVRRVKAKFDAAQTTNDNANHWSNADSLSANAALAPEIRRIIRNRARYEVANNSYARGIINTLANDSIGKGPRLQLLFEDINGAAKRVENAFTQWMAEVNLAAKLRTMRKALAQDGEAFGILTTNPKLRGPVKLDIKLVEADQIATPYQLFNLSNRNLVDGIEFDDFGNPAFYYLLNQHPGDSAKLDEGFEKIPAANVIHWFKADRPGQSRGLPEIMPALPLFAQLRRFTLAVIAAAETAADFATVIYSKTPATGETSQEIAAMDTVELERRMATVLPEGWELGQVEALQPNTTYVEFAKTILNEVARCFSMPFNVAYGNSSGYNYASGRLDHQTYFKSLDVDRSDLENVCLDSKILPAWWSEAILISNLMPVQWRNSYILHQWFWDGREHVDPAKEATAQDTRLKNKSTNYAIEYAKQGRDWESELKQSVREVAYLKQIAEAEGLTLEQVLGVKTATQTVTVDQDEDENE